MAAFNLGDALQKVKATRQNFMLFVDGKENRLLVAPGMIPNDWVAAAKTECGGTIVKGTCYYDDAAKQLVLVSKDKPKDAWAVKATKMAKAAKYNHEVTVRQLKPGEPEVAPPAAPPLPTPPDRTAAPTPDIKVAAPKGKAVAYAQLLLKWDSAKKTVKSQLDQLEKKILEDFANDPKSADIKTRVRRLDDVLGGLDDRLADTLDDALALPAESRQELNKDALEIIDEYQAYLNEDDFIPKIEANPYEVKVAVKETLGGALDQLSKALKP